jgi:L-ribulose-5-phosphate 3-epimerase UlaE
MEMKKLRENSLLLFKILSKNNKRNTQNNVHKFISLMVHKAMIKEVSFILEIMDKVILRTIAQTKETSILMKKDPTVVSLTI